jgi:hypothetical protein
MADVDVWCDLEPTNDDPKHDVETMEAEVVFLIRQAGQWPASQTEIHFHQSTSAHRTVAATMVQRYRLQTGAP